MAENDDNIVWSETDNEEADWIKTNSWNLPTDPDEFLSSLGGMSLDHFMTLPAAKAMPASLANELIKSGHLVPKK